jgi:hypothetical protein
MPDQLIPSDVVKAIQAGVETKVLTIDEREYVTRQIYNLPLEPRPERIQVTTLQGFCEYLNLIENNDTARANVAFVQVVDPTSVLAISPVYGRDSAADVVIEANCSLTVKTEERFRFGTFYDHESFIIALQSQFAPTPHQKSLLALIGNIRDETVKSHSDDGTTQTVTVRAGIVKVSEMDVPNPITLQPYRTFHDVEQPPSQFVFRLKRKEGDMPQAALIEADGGAWKHDAMKSIASYLREHLKDRVVIA